MYNELSQLYVTNKSPSLLEFLPNHPTLVFNYINNFDTCVLDPEDVGVFQ